MDWDTQLHGKGTPVRSLLTDLYEKAGELRHWNLIRMISGMLKKKVEELDSVRRKHRHGYKKFGVTVPEWFFLLPRRLCFLPN